MELPLTISLVAEIAVLSAAEEIFKETLVARACVVSATEPTFLTLFAIYV